MQINQGTSPSITRLSDGVTDSSQPYWILAV